MRISQIGEPFNTLLCLGSRVLVSVSSGGCAPCAVSAISVELLFRIPESSPAFVAHLLLESADSVQATHNLGRLGACIFGHGTLRRDVVRVSSDISDLELGTRPLLPQIPLLLLISSHLLREMLVVTSDVHIRCVQQTSRWLLILHKVITVFFTPVVQVDRNSIEAGVTAHRLVKRRKINPGVATTHDKCGRVCGGIVLPHKIVLRVTLYSRKLLLFLTAKHWMIVQYSFFLFVAARLVL